MLKIVKLIFKLDTFIPNYFNIRGKNLLRGAVKIKNVIKLWKKSKRGGGSALKIKKSTIQNVDYFETRGGSGFSNISQIQMTEIWP